MTKNFKNNVLSIVFKIPKGEVSTYKEVAVLAQSKHGARAVGTLMRKNYDPKIPCHRVIHSDGRIGQYNKGEKLKTEMLKREGISINQKGKIQYL